MIENYDGVEIKTINKNTYTSVYEGYYFLIQYETAYRSRYFTIRVAVKNPMTKEDFKDFKAQTSGTKLFFDNVSGNVTKFRVGGLSFSKFAPIAESIKSLVEYFKNTSNTPVSYLGQTIEDDTELSLVFDGLNYVFISEAEKPRLRKEIQEKNEAINNTSENYLLGALALAVLYSVYWIVILIIPDSVDFIATLCSIAVAIGAAYLYEKVAKKISIKSMIINAVVTVLVTAGAVLLLILNELNNILLAEGYQASIGELFQFFSYVIETTGIPFELIGYALLAIVILLVVSFGSFYQLYKDKYKQRKIDF